jgi:hypothetical protein
MAEFIDDIIIPDAYFAQSDASSCARITQKASGYSVAERARFESAHLEIGQGMVEVLIFHTSTFGVFGIKMVYLIFRIHSRRGCGSVLELFIHAIDGGFLGVEKGDDALLLDRARLAEAQELIAMLKNQATPLIQP